MDNEHEKEYIIQRLNEMYLEINNFALAYFSAKTPIQLDDFIKEGKSFVKIQKAIKSAIENLES
jgi:hypothetical protein